ncbi:hypothetical protein AC579_1738 [Pseudocercospora musae]|uniref:Uncharacterized protein n=1 Tax=Pseudocercospora musae TaxID=113226 RepID=A0A139IF26_9PEZI|nr:hypothetical protein AC579_1738 [Pseudocercospora musae]
MSVKSLADMFVCGAISYQCGGIEMWQLWQKYVQMYGGVLLHAMKEAVRPRTRQFGTGALEAWRWGDWAIGV